jgi:pilus assembly protein Flp/PilA
MMKQFRRLMDSRAGVTAIEYGLIAALISVVLISALTVMGPTIKKQFFVIDTAIKGPKP